MDCMSTIFSTRKLPERPLLGMGSYRAGVQEDDVRVFRLPGDLVALRRQHPEHLLGIPRVHLTTICLQKNAFTHHTAFLTANIWLIPRRSRRRRRRTPTRERPDPTSTYY